MPTRKREGDISTELEQQVFAAFAEEVEHGFLSRHPITHEHALRTRDAMHLAIACGIGTNTIATADHIMAEAAESLAMDVVMF